ncbi:MAG: flavodoxin family protein [Cyclobacteriaceae bacterium]
MPAQYNDLKALYLNCTLKKSPHSSHTRLLIDYSRNILKKEGVSSEVIRPVDLDLPPGVYPDMTEHGFDKDDWPGLFKKVMEANILFFCTPIWLGEKSSVCTHLIERLYSNSSQTNDKGQYIYYGKTGGTIITGNEDGGKHCAMSILYSLQHLGYTIPPQADTYWVGEAGPGPSYGDDGTGLDNEFTQRNTTFLTYNLLHMARMLKDQGGIPAAGNTKEGWKSYGPDHPNPEYR